MYLWEEETHSLLQQNSYYFPRKERHVGVCRHWIISSEIETESFVNEDSLHNDSVLARITMRHERWFPSVPQANRVSIHYIGFLRLQRALFLCPAGRGTVLKLCDSEAVPESQIWGWTWLWDNRAVLCCFITQDFRIQSGMFDKQSINETSIHGWSYRFFFGCCRGTLKVQTRDFKAGISWKVILHSCRQNADNIPTSIN